MLAPSTPTLDGYSPTYLVARRGGAVEPGFRGEVWIWTDGPYIRPYHHNFTSADRGLIRTPLKFQGGQLQRVESYQLGPDSTISLWSNPVLPAQPGEPRLLWGAIDNCDQPGLDFCLSESGRPPSLPGLAAVGLRRTGKGAQIRVINPGGAGDTPLPEFDGAPTLDRSLIGAWVSAPTAAGVFEAFRRGTVYYSSGGRILIKPLTGWRALVAGYGPSEEVTVTAGGSGKKYSTDDYHLTVPLPEGKFNIVVREAGRAAFASERSLAAF